MSAELNYDPKNRNGRCPPYSGEDHAEVTVPSAFSPDLDVTGQDSMLKRRNARCLFSNDGPRQMSRHAHDPLPLKPAPVRHRSNGAKQLSSFAPLHRCCEGESAHLVPLRRQAVAHRKRRMERDDQQPRQVLSLQLRVTLEFDARNNFGCNSRLMSPISSRNSEPRSASSKRPFCQRFITFQNSSAVRSLPIMIAQQQSVLISIAGVGTGSSQPPTDFLLCVCGIVSPLSVHVNHAVGALSLQPRVRHLFRQGVYNARRMHMDSLGGKCACDVQGPSRREFLIALAALGASTVLQGGASLAQTPAVPAKPKLVDVHHHILPPAYLEQARTRIIAQGQGYLPPRVLQWTPENSLAEMEQNRVATAIVSISTPGIWFGEVQAARTLSRKCNEYAARLVGDNPGRFGFFAAVPLPDTEGSLREITHALDVLKADGIGLMTSYGDRWPGDPAYTPVFGELNRRKAVVYFHPTGPNCCRDLIPNVPYMFTEVLHDTTRAVTSLLFSGSFGRFPDIRFIFSHAGGTLPMIAGRIARQSSGVEELAAKIPNGVEYELKRLYYDIAGSANRPAIAALTNLVPTSQILFGSDYPWVTVGTTAGGMTKLGLSIDDLRAIGRDNAVSLLPRLRA